jgi:tetratricopeptide (TPR) repeat protein
MSNRTSAGAKRPVMKPTPSKQRRSSARAGAADAPPQKTSSLLRFVLAGVALVALVLIGYSNSLSNGFVWDDHEQIVVNPAVQPGAPLAPIFAGDVRFAARSQTVQNKDYRPLQMVTYRLLAGATGMDASAFHLCNLLFGIACTLISFALLWQVTRRWSLAFAGAALFALYPVHTEAIDWIAALPDLGAAFFVLAGFALFLASRRQMNAQETSTPRWLPSALSWIAVASALLWKESSVIFPLLVMAYVLLLEETTAAGHRLIGRIRAALMASAPYWALLVAYFALRIGLIGSLGNGMRDWELTPVQELVNMLALMEAYWAKLALPVNLNAYVVFTPLRSLVTPGALLIVLVAALAAALMVFLLMRLRRIGLEGTSINNAHRTLRMGLFAALWVLITLLPAMNLSALGRNAFTERYLYLPSWGFCLLVVLIAAWLLQRLPSNAQRYAGTALLATILAGFLYETVERNPVWKDDATLWSVTLEASPTAPFVHNAVATAESSDASQTDDEAHNYEEAITFATHDIPPDRIDALTAYQGLAWIYADRQQYPQALATLEKAAALEPDNADTLGEQGLILARSGDGLAAEPLLTRALDAEQDNENVLSALGLVARDDLHQPQRAITLFTRALAVHPAEDDFAASQHNNLGAVYADQGNFAAAVTQLREAERILPNDPEFHTNLANALAAQGQFEQARSEADIAVHLAPQDPAAQQVLGEIEQQLRGR